MSFAVLGYAFLLFLLCFGAHVLIWRIKTPWVSSLILLVIFLVLPAAVVLVLVASSLMQDGGWGVRQAGLVEILLLHLALSLAYIASYPAARAVSPSLDILLMISSVPEQRMTEEEMVRRYTKARLVTARIDDLVVYRLIRKVDDHFELEPLARLITRGFLLYRAALGLPAGRG